MARGAPGAINLPRVFSKPGADPGGNGAPDVPVVIPPAAIERLQGGAVARACNQAGHWLNKIGDGRAPLIHFATEKNWLLLAMPDPDDPQFQPRSPDAEVYAALARSTIAAFAAARHDLRAAFAALVPFPPKHEGEANGSSQNSVQISTPRRPA